MKKKIERNEVFGKIIYDLESDSISLDYNDSAKIITSQGYLSAPTNIFLELTDLCNLKCQHCFNGEIENRQCLSIEEWKKTIDQITNMKVFYVKITGGEPFLYPNLFELLEYMDKKRLNYLIYTNGTYISQNIEKIVNLRYLKMIRVSLEGTKEANDRIRGAGVFDTAINAIRMLEEKGIPCSINYTINRENYHLLPELESYLQNQCGMSTPIHLGLIKHAGNSLTNNRICFFDPMEYNQIISSIETIIERSSIIERLYMLPEYYYKIYGNHFGCPAAQTSVVIKANGNVIPCGLLPETEFTICGNIKEESLYSLWTCEKINKFRTLIPPKKCLLCEEYLSNCTGACRANAFNLEGNIQGNDINCSIYKSSLARQHKTSSVYDR